MDRTLPLFAIGLIFGGGIGFTIAAAGGITLDGHDHGDPAHHGAHHAAAPAGSETGHHGAHHMPFVVPAGTVPPFLDVTLHPDPLGGWNVQAEVSGFRYAPERSGIGASADEGHAHLYVNGVKVARMYGPWMHLASVPDGEVTITVGLYTNDHRPLHVGADPVQVSVAVPTE